MTEPHMASIWGGMGDRLLCARCSGLQHLWCRPAMTGRTAVCKELFMQSEIDHLGSYCGAKFG